MQIELTEEEMNKNYIQKEIESSSFSKQKYTTTLHLTDFKSSMMFYINALDGDGTNNSDKYILDDVIKEGTPIFQRNNDKWSKEMQSKFVENILKGCSTKIQLFSLNHDNIRLQNSRCQIIDGLQRTTALVEFFKNNVEVFGVTHDKIKELFPTMFKSSRLSLQLEIYDFNNLKEAIEFYIDMNKNITHSPEDILKASEFLKPEFGAEKVISLWNPEEEKMYKEYKDAYNERIRKEKEKKEKLELNKAKKLKNKDGIEI